MYLKVWGERIKILIKPIVDTHTHLEEIFYLEKQGFPLGVVNHKKQFSGMVEAVDVLTSLVRENQNSD